MIVGPVASGKSSALMALLGEIPVAKADLLAVRGSVAYVGQQPWIFSDTLRENITFGKTFQRSKYEEVNLLSLSYRFIAALRHQAWKT